MLLAHGPEAACVRVGGHAFEHHRGRPVGERPVDNIAVAGDPADVSGAPEHVALMIVERVLVGHRGINDVAPGGVDHAFRHAGRAGGIEDEQRVLGGHFLGRAIGGDICLHLMQPVVAARGHGNLAAGAFDDKHFGVMCDRLKRLVAIDLEGRVLAAARGLVGRDHDLGLRPVHPRRKRVGGEAREDNGMDRPDARAGQHGIGRLRDHRDVKHHAVAFADAHFFQDIGEFTDMRVQLLVGDVLGLAVGVIGLPDDGRLIATLRQMAVDAIGSHVQRAVLIPFDIDLAVCVRDVLDLAIGLDPVNALAMLAPEGSRVLDAVGIHFVIGCLVGMGIRRKLRRGCVGRVGHGLSLGFFVLGMAPRFWCGGA